MAAVGELRQVMAGLHNFLGTLSPIAQRASLQFPARQRPVCDCVQARMLPPMLAPEPGVVPLRSGIDSALQGDVVDRRREQPAHRALDVFRPGAVRRPLPAPIVLPHCQRPVLGLGQRRQRHLMPDAGDAAQLPPLATRMRSRSGFFADGRAHSRAFTSGKVRVRLRMPSCTSM